MLPAKNVVKFLFVNDQLMETHVSLVFDSDLNAYKGLINTTDFKFPLLVNLTTIQIMNRSENKSYELLFSHNEKDSVGVFLFEGQQKIYSGRHKTMRLNEQIIYEILYKHDCDEATLYFDGNNFEFIYQTDKSNHSILNAMWSFVNSLPAKVLYALILSYKAYTVITWLRSLEGWTPHSSE